MAEVVVNRNGAYRPAPRAQVYDIREGEDVTLTCDVQSAREPIRGEIRVSNCASMPHCNLISSLIISLSPFRSTNGVAKMIVHCHAMP